MSTVLLYGRCSWINDDLPECPSGWRVRLSYSYNMLNVDAVATEVSNATIFIFDTKDSCILREDVDSLTLQQNNYLIKLPVLPTSEYTILVWAGLSDEHYQYTPSALMLSRDETGEQADRIAALFHGRLDGVVLDEQEKILEIPLTKNTNTLSCVLQSLTEVPMKADEFRLELTAHNGRMDHKNIPMDTSCICYLPFLQSAVNTDGLQVVHAGLNTLRLLENDETDLTLIYIPTGQQIFSIPLCQYLLLSGQVHASNMGTQVYLDRQAQYNLLFFLMPTDNPQQPYLCTQMEVNGWRVRLNDAALGRKDVPWNKK